MVRHPLLSLPDRNSNAAMVCVFVCLHPGISSPLLETSIDGASDLIFSITGDISLWDVADAANYVGEKTGDNVNLIFGFRYDDSTDDACSVTIIATGINDGSGSCSI